jgi:spore coat protein U-like protein
MKGRRIPLSRALVPGASVLAVCSALLAVPQPATAGNATTTLGVSLTITAACTVTSSPVAFGSQGLLTSAVPATGSLTVTCTDGTVYNVALDAGQGTGATVTNRLMTGPSTDTVSYGLFQDAGLATNWGATKAGTGNGSAVTLNVYGNIPAQTSPSVGLYADTVGVLVTF